MNSKFWIYPLSVYLTAAALFSVGCADDNKKKRVPITNAQNPRGGGNPTGDGQGGEGITTSGAGGGGAKTPDEIKTQFDKLEAPVVKAASTSTADQINNKLAEINKGISVKAIEDLAPGVYEVKWIGLVGKLTSKEFSRHTLLTAVINDLSLEKVDAAFFSTAKEAEAAAKKDAASSTQADSAQGKRKGQQLSQAEIQARREKLDADRKDRKNGGQAHRSGIRDSKVDATFANIFTFEYAFARILKVSQAPESASHMEETNPAQVNLFVNKSGRESKLVFSAKDADKKTIREAIGSTKAQADGTYKDSSIEIAFSQSNPEELQMTLSEVKKSSSGKGEVLKSIIIRYARRADSAPAKKTVDPEKQAATAVAPQEQTAIVDETKVEVK